MRAYAVSRKVNDVKNETPDLIKPAEAERDLFS